MIKNKTLSAVLFTLLWLFFCLFPWQSWLSNFPVLGFLIGLLVYLVPGILTFLYFDENRTIHLRTLLGGLIVSVFFTGILGLLARLFQLNFTFIRWGFALWGVVFVLLMVYRSFKWEIHFEKIPWWEMAFLVAGVGGTLYFITLVRPPLIHDDAFTYNALLYYFQHAPRLNFVFPDVYSRMSIPRFWIAYWPLVEALISGLSGIDGLIITGIYLPLALAAFSFLGIYVLGRTLGLPRPAAALAILAQGFSLMRLTRFNQPGNLFFQRLTEDKVVAAFVLSLIMFMLVVEYLESPSTRKLFLAGVAAFALVVTHPIQFGMSCMIVGVYGLIFLFNKDMRWKYAALIGVLALIILIPYSFRFTGGEYSQTLSFSMADVTQNDQLARLGVRRVDVIAGTRFYGISRYLTTGLPYEIGLVAALVSLFFFWRNKAARFVLSAFLVLGISVFPYTGWLIGFFTTPFQLWRLTWQMPFGLAFGFLAWAIWLIRERVNFLKEWDRFVQPAFYIAWLGAALAVIIFVQAWAVDNLNFNNLNYYDIYSDYITMGNYMNNMQVTGSPLILGAPDPTTNAILPSLTLKFIPIAFRVTAGPPDSSLWNSLVYEKLTPQQRLDALHQNHIEYMLLRGEPDWMIAFKDAYPDKIKLVFEDKRLGLYQILP